MSAPHLSGSIRIALPLAVVALVAGLFLWLLPRDDDSRRSTPAPDHKSAETTSATPVPVEEDAAIELVIPDPTAEAMVYTGRVLHAITSSPLDGVRVTALTNRARFGSLMKWEEIGGTATDGDGRFHLSPSFNSPRPVTLRVEKRGFVSQVTGISFPEAARQERIVYLTPGVEITGEVIFADGTPVAGGKGHIVDHLTPITEAWFSPGNREARFHGWGRTEFTVDSRGRFAITVGADRVALEVNGPDYAPAFSSVVFPSPEKKHHVVIRVVKGQTLTGRVRDENGRGVAGARVGVTPVVRDVEPDRFFNAYPSRIEAASGSDGSFTLVGLPPRYQSLSVEHDDYVRYRADDPAGVDDGPLEIVLDAGQWLTGTIHPENARAEGGRPIRDSSSSLRDGKRQLARIAWAHDLRFRSGPFDLDTTRATLKIFGFASTDLTWPEGPGAKDLGEIRLEAGTKLRVSVRDGDGLPVPGAAVSVHAREGNRGSGRYSGYVTTDAEGKGATAGLEGPQIEVRIAKEGFGPWSEIRTIGDDAVVVEATLKPASGLRGIVVGGAGQPVFGARIHVEAEDPSQPFRRSSLSAFSTPEGRFVMRDLRSDTALSLGVGGRGLAMEERKLSPLSPGEHRDLGTILLGGGFSVSGAVEDEKGAGLVGAMISRQRIDPNSFGFSQVDTSNWSETDASGAFRLTGLSEGNYSIFCRAPGYATPPPQTFQVDRDITGILFTPQRGEPYEAIVVDAEGGPVSEAYLQVSSARSRQNRQHAQTDTHGRFRIPSLPEGSIEIWIHHNDFLAWNSRFNDANELPGRIVLDSGAALQIQMFVKGERTLPGRVTVSLKRERSSHSKLVLTKNGIAEIMGLEPGTFELQVVANGFPPSRWVPVDLRQGETPSVTVTLDGTREPVTIRVLDLEGEPISGAQISVTAGADSLRGRNSGGTDNAGQFITNALDAESVLDIWAPGHAPAMVEKALSRVSGGEITVRLEAESAFLVTVRGPDGELLDGVQVHADPDLRDRRRRMNMFHGLLRSRSQTREGKVRLGELAAGSYRVHFNRGQDALGSRQESLRAGEERAIEFRLDPTFAIEGIVRKNGLPVAGGSMRIHQGSNATQTTIRPDGTFRAQLRAAGTYTFFYSSDVRYGQTIRMTREITGPGSIEIDFQLVRLAAEVRLPDGSAAAGVEGHFSGSSHHPFVTDRDGRFVLEDVVMGKYSWRFDKTPPLTFAPNRSVDVTSSTELTYRFQPGVEIAVDALPGEVRKSVYHLSEQGERSHLRKGSAAGTFIWPAATGAGYVSAPGYAPAFFEILEPTDPTPVRVALRKGGKLKLSIVDEGGEPAGEHPFELASLDEAFYLPPAFRKQETGSSGRRTLTLAPGRYRVSSTLPSGESVEREVTVVEGETQEVSLP